MIDTAVSHVAGATDSRSAAMQSQIQRRSYGAAPSSACISKSTERALTEHGRRSHQQALNGNSPDDILDDLAYADQEEQEGSMWQEEDVWQRPASAQQRSAINTHQSGLHRQNPPGLIPGLHVQQPCHASMSQSTGVVQTLGSAQHAQALQAQEDLSVHLQAWPPHEQQAQHLQSQQLQSRQVLQPPHDQLGLQEGGSEKGAMPLCALYQTVAAVPDTALQDEGSAQHFGLGVVSQSAHQAAAEPPHDAVMPTHTEQSDRELALRLQAEENAQPQPGRVLAVKAKAKKPSGTIHAFFKKA